MNTIHKEPKHNQWTHVCMAEHAVSLRKAHAFPTRAVCLDNQPTSATMHDGIPAFLRKRIDFKP